MDVVPAVAALFFFGGLGCLGLALVTDYKGLRSRSTGRAVRDVMGAQGHAPPRWRRLWLDEQSVRRNQESQALGAGWFLLFIGAAGVVRIVIGLIFGV